MAKKHTKAPWGWQLFGKQTCLTAQHGMREIIISANSSGNLLMNDDGILYPIDENHPNAKLIAAAPELLEALKEMVTMYEEVEPCGGYQGVYESAVYAIKKATE